MFCLGGMGMGQLAMREKEKDAREFGAKVVNGGALRCARASRGASAPPPRVEREAC